MKKIKLFAALMIAAISIPAYAATYYVAPTGNDANNGTTLATPVKTIKAGLSKAKATDDIVYVMTGVYEEAVNVSQNGITLSAYPDNKPVIDGTTKLPVVSWGVLLAVSGNNNKVSGFEVKNSNMTGTFVGGYGIEVIGHHNLISNMNVHHTWEQAVYIHGDYNTVEDSSVWQGAFRNSRNTGQVTSGWGTGMSAARNRNAEAIKPGITSHATFRRNKVYNNWGEGLSCFEADYCVLEDNVVYDNWTINIYISDTSNSLIQRNLVYTSLNPAIVTRKNLVPSTITLADELPAKPRSKNNVIINNITYGGAFEAFKWTLVKGYGLDNVTIANNTIVGNFFTGADSVNSVIKNNIVTGSVTMPSKNGLTVANNSFDSQADPMLIKTGSTQSGQLTSDYFRLSQDSPMIGKGALLANVKDDFFKSARKSTPDIGAIEFNTPTPTPDPIPDPIPVLSGVRVTVTMPISVRDAIKADAKTKKVTMSKHITTILSDYLKNK